MAANLTPARLAEAVQVDTKTVERWISAGRVPHRRHRWAAARILDVDEEVLWPLPAQGRRRAGAGCSELLDVFPSRKAVPRQLWHSLLERTAQDLSLLAISGLFLVDDVYPDLAHALCAKGDAGVRVRVLLGDPSAESVRRRGLEEGIGDGLAARSRLTLTYLAGALHSPTVDLRLHGATLYASIYRFDEDMLVNVHAYGAPAGESPVLHIRDVNDGGLFRHYLTSFDRVWETAATAPGSQPEE